MIFNGEYDARVLENNDPMKKGRIKVACPDLYLSITNSPWIPSSEIHSGSMIVPNKNDVVGVRCINGDVNNLRYTTTRHKDGQTPSSAVNTVPFTNKGTSSFDTSVGDTVTEPEAAPRSEYPLIKTILENDIAFLELDDNGRFQYYNKQTKHFMEWHPDGTLVIKAKNIWIETDDSSKGISINSAGRIDISSKNKMSFSAYSELGIWTRKDLTVIALADCAIRGGLSIGMIATKNFSLKSGHDMDISCNDNMYIIGNKIDKIHLDR